MKPKCGFLKTRCALTLIIGGMLAAGSVMAEKPAWAGKAGRNEQMDRRDERGGERRDGDQKARHDGDNAYAGKHRHFEDQHHGFVREYYEEQFRGGRCPPGLAKKHNRCTPPGQARKWQVGRPLPREVVYYEVPQPLVIKIGLPPSGHRYVRVATDILLIAIGTGMVVDAIQDLGR